MNCFQPTNSTATTPVSYTHLVGIHNTLEAAVYGIPVIFGPKYQTFQEAIQLLEAKGAFSVKDYMGADIISKGARFSASDFSDLDFTAVQLSKMCIRDRFWSDY